MNGAGSHTAFATGVRWASAAAAPFVLGLPYGAEASIDAVIVVTAVAIELECFSSTVYRFSARSQPRWTATVAA